MNNFPGQIYFKSIAMSDHEEKWEVLLGHLKVIEGEVKLFNRSKLNGTNGVDGVLTPFRGVELYLLHKAFIDSGGAPHEDYKTLLKRTAPYLNSKAQKGFSPDSLPKYSDKVDPETKENVKRFLMKMIRNIDSYD